MIGSNMIAWMLGIAVSIALLVITAAYKAGDIQMAYAHMAIAAFMCLLFAIMSVRETVRLQRQDASRPAVAASSARHMGYVWAWGALGLVISYGTGIVDWHEWLHFFLAFVIAGCAALFFAMLLQRDAETGKEDETILKISRYMGWAQLVGMILVMVGLLIDGKMTRFLHPDYGDWAANNIFFFGAMALAVISAYALRASAEKAEA